MDKTLKRLAKKHLGITGSVTDDEILDRLDEAVHDCASSRASDVNNEGIEAQLVYIGAM